MLLTLAAIPTEALAGLPAVCPFKRYFGIECYGCGMTRALSALLHGQFHLALAYNRGVVLLAPLLGCAALLPARFARRTLRNKPC